MTIATFARGALTRIQENSPVILTSLAVAGAATTAYLSSRAGYVAGDRLWKEVQHRVDNDPDFDGLTGKEKFELCWRLYIPAALALASTIGFTIGSHAVSTRRNAALMSAVTLGEAALREYRDKVEEVVTRTKRDEIHTGIAQDKLDTLDSKEIYMVTDGEILLFDTLTARIFKGTQVGIKEAEVEMTRRILNSDYISQNEWYDAIGLPRTEMGDDHGWNHQTPLEVNFVALIKDNKPVMGIGYRFLPTINFDR